MRNDRLAQAYLLHGPDGVGKSSLAEVLIRLLVCSRPGPDAACGCCPDCRMMAAGSHPDVLRLEGEGRLGIDQVRRIQAALCYRPYGRIHVCCVDPADQLTIEAANAFLKTLEEPQGRAVFILLSSAPEQIPLTVRSRCIRIPFRRLSREEILQGLETMGYKGAEAAVTAALAEGSLGKALEMAGGNRDSSVRDEMIALAMKLDRMRPADIAALAQEIGSRAALDERLRALLVWYRDLLFWRETQDPGLLVNSDRRGEVEESSNLYSPRELERTIRKIDNALRRLSANGNPRLIAEVLLLGLAAESKSRAELCWAGQ